MTVRPEHRPRSAGMGIAGRLTSALAAEGGAAGFACQVAQLDSDMP